MYRVSTREMYGLPCLADKTAVCYHWIDGPTTGSELGTHGRKRIELRAEYPRPMTKMHFADKAARVTGVLLLIAAISLMALFLSS